MQDPLKSHKVTLVMFVNTQGKYSGEAASLAGKIDPKAMGGRSERESHKMPGTRKPKPTPKISSTKMNVEKRDLLNANIEDGSSYRPKTKQNIQVYSVLLSKIYKHFGDVPEEELHSIANEILATLMTEGLREEEKRAEIESLFQGDKLPSELYADLVNISKNITDYKLEDNDQHDETNALIFENQEEEEQISVIEEEEEEQTPQHQNEAEGKVQMEEEKPAPQPQNYNVDISRIDGNWLLVQLSQFYSQEDSQHKESQILQYMRIKNKNEYSDKLLTLLGMERKELVKLLIINKAKIYYCVKLGKLTSDKEKEQLIQQMRRTTEGEDIIQQLLTKKITNITLPNTLKREKAKDEEEGNTKVELKNEDVAKVPKKIIDLETIINIEKQKHQSDKLLVPEGSEKIAKTGYEEIRIPAPETFVDEKLVKIDTFPTWIQECFPGVKKFNPVQSRVLDWAISSPKNMLICAPTSSGKTNIAMMAILQTLKQYLRPDGSFETSKFKIVYIAPMKALVSEITGNLGGRLKSLKVRQLTGDMQLTKQQINETQIIVTTPEKWDIVTRKAGDRLFTELVRLVIIDEIHLLGDSRGPVLEAIIARTIRQVEQTQQLVRIVGLSATLPNYKDIAQVLRVEPQGTFYFDGRYRPIPLQQIYIGISEKKGVRKMLMLNEILYEKIMERSGNNNNAQILVFVHSRRDTVRTAKSIRETAFMKDQLMKILRPDSDSKKVLTTTAESRVKDEFLIHNEDLRSLLADGIGIHHAGLSRDDRQLVENLFADKHIQILVSTATLAWGVNLPAHTVIIKGTQVYSPEEGKWVELSQQDIFQMMGRAGRLKYDTSGEGIIITGYNELRYYLGILNTQFPIESQFVTQLPDQLNAEIVLGNITNLKQAVDWLGYTYLNVRMLKSPAQYGITVEELEEDPHLVKRRVHLIHSAATLLDKSGLIKYDKRANTFSSTALGKIASYYYVKYQSIAIYNENIKPSMNLIDLFKIFAMSVEFKLLPVRQEEKGELARLIETVPIPVKGTIEDTTTKISILLQAYISRIPMEGYALNSDKVYVTQSASRIMRAIYEICLRRNWGQATQVALNASKMIDRGMWSCMNPLRQFKEVPDIILSKLQKKEQFSWETFYQMSAQQISELIREPRLGKPLYKLVHQIPRVEIEAYAQPITTSCLRVDVNVKSDFSWDDSIHGREEPFVLIVLDCDEEHILYTSNFSLKKDEKEQFIQFTVPIFDPPHPIYYIKVFSDRWVTQQHTLPLSFKSLKLPSKFPAPTELQDQRHVSLTDLPDFAHIVKQTKITQLYQIQGQVFKSFVYDDSNLFLGASAGSGKFTLSIFAIYKTLKSNKKVIILMPNQQSIKNRYQTLSKIWKERVTYFVNQTNKDIESLSKYDIIVTSPESWDVVSRRWKIRKGFESIGLFVVVDIHLIGESGSTMEILISRMRYISSQLPKPIRIIALGCSIANYRDVAEWVGCPQENMFNFSSSIRQHPIQIIIQSFDQVIRESRIYSMEKQVYQNIKQYGRSSIIFVNDRRQAKLTALDMVTLINSDSNSKRFMKMSEVDLKVFLKNINDKYLAFSLEHGVGFLYEGMTENDRDIIQELFQVEAIGILIVTFKLRWEINLKAFLVAVLDCSTFQGRESRWVDYSIPDMLQMMSTAVASDKDRKRGRQFLASKFYVMSHSSKREFYKKFLFQSYPVESTLNFYLPTHVNAEIVSKTIQSKEDCIDWITWTFMYRRLTQNPNYYNLQEASEIGINDYLSEIIENTVEYLESIKCIEVQAEGEEKGEGEDEEEKEPELSPTNLGIVCSYYYISVTTMATFVEKLTEDEKLRSLVELLSEATEFDFVSYRAGERQLVAELCVPLQINPINKTHGLLLLHFNRTPLTPDLLQDCRKVLPIAVRLLHSLVDVVSSFGYLKSLIAIMQLCQMVVQAIQISDSPLIQVVDKPCAQRLHKAGITSINDFVNMQDDDRLNLMKDYDDKQMQHIADLCNRYPVVTLTVNSQEMDQQSNEGVVNVSLERDNQLQRQGVKCPFYPKEKQQNWWVVVGDKSTNRVMTTKKTTFNKDVSVNLRFQVNGDVRLYTVYGFCDSYMGCDVTEQLIIQ